MNLHAINVVPINGWETHLGVGSAAVAVSGSMGTGFYGPATLGTGTAPLALNVSGSGRLIVAGAGSAVLAEIQGSGSGILARLGAGSAGMAITGEAYGYLRRFAAGDALLELLAEGEGEVILSLGGRISIDVLANGSGILAALGEGRADIELTALGDGKVRRAVFGSGQITQTLYAAGAEKMIVAGRGEASIALSASGMWRASTVHHGSGVAQIDLRLGRGEHGGWHLVYADATSMSLTMKLKAGAPMWPAIPAEFSPAHPKNTMTVPRERADLRVPRERRTA